MNKFVIAPYVGPLPVRFGMTSREVAEILGPPAETYTHHLLGFHVERRTYINLGNSADEGRLFEAVLMPTAEVMFMGECIFNAEDPIAVFQRYDPMPFEWVGLLVFLKLGVQLSGFHDMDESQKSIAVVHKGYWDEYLDGFVPFLRST